MPCTTRSKTRVVRKFKILDFSKSQWPPQRRLCMALKPIFDRQLKPLQFLNAKHIGPSPCNLSAQLAVNFLVILQPSE
jgi:hypothetical protein